MRKEDCVLRGIRDRGPDLSLGDGEGSVVGREKVTLTEIYRQFVPS